MSKFGELFFENCLMGAIFSQKSFEKNYFISFLAEIVFFLAKKEEKNHPRKRNTLQDSSRLQKRFRI